MAGGRDEPFEIDAGVAETRPGGPLHRREFVTQLGRRATEHHADATAARRALQHDRIADGLGRRHGRIDIGEQIGAGEERHPARPREVARRMLQAEGPQMAGPRADKDDAVSREPFGETDVFGQEAVARMNGLRTGRLAGRDDGLDVQVALRRRGRAEPDRLVGLQHRPREAIGVGIDRDGGDAHPFGGADHAPRYFAPVGDQDLVEHGVSRGS